MCHPMEVKKGPQYSIMACCLSSQMCLILDAIPSFHGDGNGSEGVEVQQRKSTAWMGRTKKAIGILPEWHPYPSIFDSTLVRIRPAWPFLFGATWAAKKHPPVRIIVYTCPCCPCWLTTGSLRPWLWGVVEWWSERDVGAGPGAQKFGVELPRRGRQGHRPRNATVVWSAQFPLLFPAFCSLASLDSSAGSCVVAWRSCAGCTPWASVFAIHPLATRSLLQDDILFPGVGSIKRLAILPGSPGQTVDGPSPVYT